MKAILSADSVKYPLTGVGRYTVELASHLESLADVSLKFLSPKGLFDSVADPSRGGSQSSAGEGVERQGDLPGWIHHVARQVPGAGLIYRRVLHQRQQRVLSAYSEYIYHGTNFYLPDFPGRKVVTVHDLSVFLWPQCHPKERVRVVRKHLKKALDLADAVITPSEFIRQELADYFSYPLGRIIAIPHGGPSVQQTSSLGILTRFLHKHKLQNKAYSLYVGTIEPRKNLLPLIRAYSRLPASLKQEVPLVLCGYTGWESDEIHRLIKQYTAEGWVKYLGYLAWEELPLLYAGARLFVFPSLYEGFGLPVLEAMQAGVPVLCARTSSLPEVAADSARYFEPGDESQLLYLLQSLLPDEGALSVMAKSGLQRAQSFSWDKSAKAHLAVYQSISL